VAGAEDVAAAGAEELVLVGARDYEEGARTTRSTRRNNGHRNQPVSYRIKQSVMETPYRPETKQVLAVAEQLLAVAEEEFFKKSG